MITIFHLACFGVGVIGTLFFMAMFGCHHTYETRIHKVDSFYSDGTYKCTYWIYTNTCKYCGKVKVKQVGRKQ